jgi:hypothetical protein
VNHEFPPDWHYRARVRIRRCATGDVSAHCPAQHHLESETKDVVKLGMGLVGTMAALILGLLVTSAKGNYDAQNAELIQVSANILMLDRVLSHYGPETGGAREALKGAVVHALDKMWSPSRRGAQVDSGSHGNESLYEKIHALSPKDEAQRTLKSEEKRVNSLPIIVSPPAIVSIVEVRCRSA